jgi:hypothetical protein
MKHIIQTVLIFILSQNIFGQSLANDKNKIDRHALVTRHNIVWNDCSGQIPLGNGEFCFNVDGTGLQTFGGNSLSHWGWHSFPLPEGVTQDQIPPTGTFQQGRITGPDIFPKDKSKIRNWMMDNPHPLNLGRIRLVRLNGEALVPGDIQGLSRSLDLWSGLHTSNFKINGQAVHVVTCVNPKTDMVAVRIESTLLRSGEIKAVIDFPYPSTKINQPWIGNFQLGINNKTIVLPAHKSKKTIDFRREVDAITYYTTLSWSTSTELKPSSTAGAQAWYLQSKGTSSIEFTCNFSAKPIESKVSDFKSVSKACVEHWPNFWKSGGAIDLSGSKDPRWKELERRIVLSQYLVAVQSAGSWPPAETGLMDIDGYKGQFHGEMIWWHLAHFALWDRWAMANQALECYNRFIPSARALAQQLGYKGLKWPKSVGPEGRSAPYKGNQVLLWKQPHPIFFAELDYRLHPTRATLAKWDEIVEGTADNMADYATHDEQTGIYHLEHDMPPSEQGQAITKDGVFDLAYWNWGLSQAQVWRERMGLKRNPQWDEVRLHLAPLPVDSGAFVHSAEWNDTYTKRAWEHPDPIGVFGMLPSLKTVDPETAHRTVLKVWSRYNWNRCWGWDFPWIAMAAARSGEPNLAVDMLLKEAGLKNHYDERGVCTGGPMPPLPYLPGNGGLLYAVAMMAAGWDGAPTKNAPGFPADGSWTVRWEGLKPAP